MTMTVAGVDGCRGGWMCILRNVDPPFRERAFVARSFGEILDHPERLEVVAIDIPIGLPERIAGAGRDCDVLVRSKLGKRAMAVFSVPARAAIGESDYRSACSAAFSTSDPPRQISKQMFHLFPKVREVDAAMTPLLQNRVRECHPEAAFWAMNRCEPLAEPKKLGGRVHPPGFELRLSLLIKQGVDEGFLRDTAFKRADAGPDDFLDACACAWTAARIVRGEAIRFPDCPQRDGKGLYMEILA